MALFALRIDDLCAKRGLHEMLWKYIFLNRLLKYSAVGLPDGEVKC
jgi:hypothetical protein